MYARKERDPNELHFTWNDYFLIITAPSLTHPCGATQCNAMFIHSGFADLRDAET